MLERTSSSKAAWQEEELSAAALPDKHVASRRPAPSTLKFLSELGRLAQSCGSTSKFRRRVLISWPRPPPSDIEDDQPEHGQEHQQRCHCGDRRVNLVADIL